MSFTCSLLFISLWWSYYIDYASAEQGYVVAVGFHAGNCTIVKATKLIPKLSYHSFEMYSLNYQWSFSSSNLRFPEDFNNLDTDLQPSCFDQGDILESVPLQSRFTQNPAILLAHLLLSIKTPSPSLFYGGTSEDHQSCLHFGPVESS